MSRGGLGEVGDGVVDQLVGAQVAQHGVMPGARRAGHVRAPGLGDLHREVAHAAGRRVDQDALPGAQAGGVVQRLPGGQGREWQRPGLDVVNGVRLAGERAGGAGDVLRVRAMAERVGQHAEYLIARLEQGHPETGRLDGPGYVPAQDERRRAEEDRVRPVTPVGRVHARGAHPDQDLRQARLGLAGLHFPQDFRPAQGFLADRAHHGLRHASSLPTQPPARVVAEPIVSARRYAAAASRAARAMPTSRSASAVPLSSGPSRSAPPARRPATVLPAGAALAR